tara:strand:- start:30 stop:626 length:597 start_codon:yes stop_codon:yes gene_type:complete
VARRRFQKLTGPPELRVNDRIRVSEVRLIDEKGEQKGIVALGDAKALAGEANLDLVEVAPTASPPVCRVMDYGKYKYLQKKKQKGGQKDAPLKQVRVRPKISPHDLGIKVRKAKQFLEAGHKVQVNCLFRGRELARTELGMTLLIRVGELLEEVAKVERPPSRDSHRTMSMVLALKAGAKDKTKEKPKEQEPEEAQEA